MLNRTLVLVLLLAALAGGLAGAAPARADDAGTYGRYHALVIGNDDYSALPKLNTAIADAEAVAALLERRYGHRVTLLRNATRAQMVTAVNRLRAELTEDDNLLIYYAGHGLLDRQSGAGFWLPVDAAEDNEANWFAVSTLTRNLKAMAARHVLVVADSCYSGTLTRDGGAGLATGQRREAWLERAAAQRSRTALVSGGLEPVQDGGGGRHSVFAKAFLTALQDNDGILEGQGLFARVRGPVVVDARQTPAYANIRFTGHEGGDYLFVPRDRIAAPAGGDGGEPAGRSDAVAVELAYWDAVKDSGSAAALNSYLERWPTGNFAPLARLKLSTLGSGNAAATAGARPAPPSAPTRKPAPERTARVDTGDAGAGLDGRWRGSTAYCLVYYSHGVGYEQTAEFDVRIAGRRLEGAMNATGPPEHRSGSVSGQLDPTPGIASKLSNSHGEPLVATLAADGSLLLKLPQCEVRLVRAD